MKTTKQAFHQRLDRYMHEQEKHLYLIEIIKQLRVNHPKINCRDIHYMIKPLGIGRDRFEELCRQWGFMVGRSRNRARTTNSAGVIRFDNLLTDMTLTSINQAYVSDITYFELQKKFYYITFIMDAFSRRILGYSIGSRLTTEYTTLPALKMAIRERGKLPSGIVFHSDGGGQYYDKQFLKLTAEHKFRNSMCQAAWENGKAERINGIIKNNYLIPWCVKSYAQLELELDRAVYLYNTSKPHKALQKRTPVEFEAFNITSQEQTKPRMTESFDALVNWAGHLAPSN